MSSVSRSAPVLTKPKIVALARKLQLALGKYVAAGVVN